MYDCVNCELKQVRKGSARPNVIELEDPRVIGGLIVRDFYVSVKISLGK